MMTPQEIIENNRKITEFLGHESEKYVQGHIYFGPKVGNYAFDALKYHTSWDWLVPVVEKINGMTNEEHDFLYLVTIRPDYCEVFSSDGCCEIVRNENGSTMLEMVYLTIIQFIDWYNSQQNEISFENYGNLPEEVQSIIESFDDNLCAYKECERLLKELKPHGYTFEYYLDGVPYNLQKI